MRRAPVLIASILVVGAAVWFVAHTGDRSKGSASTDTPAVTKDSVAEESPTLETPSGAATDDAVTSPTSGPDEPRAVAAELDTIHASHALDEPTLVTGRVVDRNGAKQAGCRVLAAPRVSAPSIGLKPGRSWPLDAVAIDRDGARERGRTGVRDANLDRDDERMRVREVVTDGEGRFEIEGLPAGPIRLALRSPTLAPRDLDDLTLDANAKLDLGDLTIEFPLVLEGEVVDGEGRAIAGVRIDRVDAVLAGAPQPGPSLAPPLAITGANGRFRTPPLAHGSWSLLATHPDYLAQRIDGASEDTKQTPPLIVITLQSGITLAGSVFGPSPEELAALCVIAAPERTWRDPVDLRDGEISADSLRLGAAADQRTSRVTAAGQFELSGLDATCAHVLRVGPLTARGDELACVYLTARAEAGVREIELPLARGSAVSFEARSHGTRAPVEDFDVWIDGAAPATLADEEGVAVRHHVGGVFRLSGVRFPGARPQRLTIAALGHAVYTVELYAEAGDDVALGVVTLEPLQTLEVLVTDETTGARIEGARVRAGEDLPERHALLGRPTGSTDREGIARVTSFSASGSHLCVDAEGFASQCLEFGDPGWTAREGRCEVRLARGSRVRVHVDDRQGVAVPGVVVAATSGLGRSRAVSDAKGLATFEHLPPGITEFSCVQLRQRSPEATTEASVGWNQELEVWITSAGVGRLVGRVLDRSRPVVGAELTLRVLDASAWKRGQRSEGGVAGTARSDSTGAYRFDNVELGPFALDVHVDRAFAPVRFEVVVEAPETVLDVELSTAHVRGRVLDAKGRVQPNALVWFSLARSRPHYYLGSVEFLRAERAVRDAEGRRTPCFTTDSNGAFDLLISRDVREFIVSASHSSAGAGWARVARVADAALDVEVRLAPSGTLEIDPFGTHVSGGSLVVLVPDAEPGAWLLRELRFGDSARWSSLTSGEWKAWRIDTWLDDDGDVRAASSREPMAFRIDGDRTTRLSLPLQ